MQKAGGKEKMHNRKKSINSGDNKFPRTFMYKKGVSIGMMIPRQPLPFIYKISLLLTLPFCSFISFKSSMANSGAIV